MEQKVSDDIIRAKYARHDREINRNGKRNEQTKKNRRSNREEPAETCTPAR